MSSHIIAARRTAVVPRDGAFAHLEPHQLARPVILALLADAGLQPDDIDEVIAGNALGLGGNIARVCALAGDLPDRVAGLTIDRQCVSGLDAILLADMMIRAGQAEIVIAGGVESYSRRPERLRSFASGAPSQPYDQAPFTPWPERDPNMADAAAALAHQLGISRDQQDSWACRSHLKACSAAPLAEIVALNGQTFDPFARKLTPALCKRAKPISGPITAANTAVAADAAAFCLVVSPRIAQKLKRNGLRIGAGATIGAAPDLPGLAPVTAIKSVLSRDAILAQDLAVAEIMEAYAVQAIACVNGAGLPDHIVNPGGGALARGHPIGASGAILAVRLFHQMKDGPKAGLAAIAAAGGLGTALILRSA